MSILYISYDGLMEQLGQSQILPYLRELARGREITLITFEKNADLDNSERVAAFREIARRAGIRWLPLRYHKRPASVSTAFDIGHATLVALYEFIRGRARIVHARGYVAAVPGLVLKKLCGARFIFDMRGFWVEQRVEIGAWKRHSGIHRLAVWLEKQFLRCADVVFALTKAAVDDMRRWPALAGAPIQFEVVTTCTDHALFIPPPSRERSATAPFVLGYVGNAGAAYLFEQAVAVWEQLLAVRPDARFRIVNRADHALIAEAFHRRNLSMDAVDLLSVDHRQVPAEMHQMDAAVFFIRPDPSRISSVPTRMGELLACGVPCIGNARVADVEDILEGNGVGVAVQDFEPATLRRAVERVIALAADPAIRQRCVDVSRRAYSLTEGIAVYERVYRQLEAAAPTR